MNSELMGQIIGSIDYLIQRSAIRIWLQFGIGVVGLFVWLLLGWCIHPWKGNNKNRVRYV